MTGVIPLSALVVFNSRIYLKLRASDRQEYRFVGRKRVPSEQVESIIAYGSSPRRRVKLSCGSSFISIARNFPEGGNAAEGRKFVYLQLREKEGRKKENVQVIHDTRFQTTAIRATVTVMSQVDEQISPEETFTLDKSRDLSTPTRCEYESVSVERICAIAL